MKLPKEDKVARCILVVGGIIFAIPTCLLWKDIVVGHQWPTDFNGWLGIVLMPLLSVASFGYGIFYRQVKKKDDKLQEDLDGRTLPIDDAVHDFFRRKGWNAIDRIIFKDRYDDEEH